jgi:hypothetical protein
METLLVNIFGGPGIGKSTIASGVFYLLKTRGVECELIPEFAKDCVWDDHQSIFDNQLYVFATQHHRIFRCLGKVDALVIDSPLLLPVIYGASIQNEHFEQLVVEEFNARTNINFILQRGDFEYQPNGRNQDEDEAVEIDNQVIELLHKYDVPYEDVIVSGRDDAHVMIASKVQDRLNEIRRDS